MKNLYVGNLPHSTSEASCETSSRHTAAVEKITLVQVESST